MDKLKMHSPDSTQDHIARIREMFPGCVTEARGEDGGVRLTVDFDLLRQVLSDSLVEGPQERYHLDWPGKREALLTANAPVARTLRPARSESVDFDTTRNLFIEGDNLDALKLLQATYAGRIKMIYIDPPYNTGNDYVYADDFARSAAEYLVRSNQKDAEGNRLAANTTTHGRFHSDWLSMMYSRLRVARDLLSEDGTIFISIDDGEVGNLRKLADQIFGEVNFIANIVWQKKYTRANDARWFSDNHDHILCYARSRQRMTLNMLPRNDEQRAAYSNPDGHAKGDWKATPLHAKSGTDTREYRFRNGVVWKPPVGTYRRFNDESLRRMDEGDEIWFGADGRQIPSRKSFLRDVNSGVTPVTLWPYDEVGHNHEANNELKALDLGSLFTNPKPTRLIKRALLLATGPEDLVLDFFAGSGTVADAVFQLNAEDGGNRRFILVQLPEPCKPGSEACRTGFRTIAEISKERIRRGGRQALIGTAAEGWNRDVGFRVMKVDTSNLADVYYSPDELDQENLDLLADNIKPDRTPEDLLFQVMLDWGVDLALPVSEQPVQGRPVWFVDDDALAACFDAQGGIDDAFVRELAGRQPRRVVFRDAGFRDSAARINVEQIFRLLSPSTDVKCL